MRARREPSPPPQIPGFEYVKLLGLGGFADVFEYRQDLPSRSVAVKVLLASSLDAETRERFTTEANLMARLSHHPSIVTIHHADLSPDGRPYLVMDYCSRPGLGSRYRSERISVQETLRTGIRLASAVEAAHRLGILHRDIKPANILTTDFGYPALTDFGIAAATGGSGAAGTGMSIPWSPPELLQEEPHGDVRGDVYSLGATIYSMLAGRSPFEIAGQPNGAADLIYRIERSPLPNIERDDVPPALQAVLARSMSKDPVRRYPSAVGLAHALQQIERSLGFAVTQIDVPDPSETIVPRARVAEQETSAEQTRARPIVTIDPVQRPAAPVPLPPPPAPVPVAGVPASPGDAVAAPQGPGFLTPPPTPDGSVLGAPGRRGAAEAAEAAAEARGGRGRAVAAIVSGLVVVGLVVAAVVFSQGRPPVVDPTETATTPVAGPTTIGTGRIPSPNNLAASATADGTVRFTWSNPEPEEGDSFLWGVKGTDDRATVRVPYVDVPLPEDGVTLCLEVSLVRSTGKLSTKPAEVCFP